MKSLFSSLSLLFFALLAFIGVLMVLAFFDLSGIHTEPLLINKTPFSVADLEAVAKLVNSPPKIEWSNPMARQPLPDSFTTPTASSGLPIKSPTNFEAQLVEGTTPEIIPTLDPTSTPIPPMEPVEYRMEVTLRAKSFADALESFLAANDRLSKEEALLKEPVWRSEMSTILTQVVETGRALSLTGPPPPEYSAIYTWLARIGPEVESLRDNYQHSLDSQDPSGFTAAGENFNHIKEDLSAALLEMSKVGWPLE